MQYRIVVAVGATAPVNEVARALVHQIQPLAILPFGSGNGLARQPGYSLRTDDAMKLLGNIAMAELTTVWPMMSLLLYLRVLVLTPT